MAAIAEKLRRLTQTTGADWPLRLGLGLLALGAVALPPATMAADATSSVQAQLAEEYAGAIHALTKKYCLGCHSAEKREGELDLERFATASDVRGDTRAWIHVAEMLDNGEMPPEDAAQPTSDERKQLRDWIKRFLDAEALAHAGDPGPVILRRLNNAEYTYTIRDLTHVELDPAREFPGDSAAGEGFTNTGGSLAMSPALLAKYLDAGKEIAAHAELLPDGFRFSPATMRRDWINLRLAELRAFYQSNANARQASTPPDLQGIEFDASQGIRLAFEDYVAAADDSRDALRTGSASIEAVAEQQGLNAKYLQIFWEALQRDDTMPVLAEMRQLWRAGRATPSGSVGASPGEQPADGRVQPLITHILQWQKALWRFSNIGWIMTQAGPQTWQQPITPLASEQNIRVPLSAPAGEDAVTLHLVCRDAGDGNAEDFAIWRQPRLAAPGRPDLPLVDVRDFYREITARRPRLLNATAEALGAAAEAEQDALRAAQVDSTALAQRRGVDAESLATWFKYLGTGSLAADRLDRFVEQRTHVEGHAFASAWGPAEAPHVTANASDQEVRIPGILRAHGVCVHPSNKAFVGIGWQSPIAGRIKMEGQLTHVNTECGDGVEWILEFRRGATRREIAKGDLHGKEPAKLGPFEEIDVQPGDLVTLQIGPREELQHACDFTDVALSIKSAASTSSAELAWNLADDVSGDLLKANPHADRLGNPNVWHFYQEPLGARATQPMTPPGSLLARWQAASTPEEKGTLATELESLLASGPAPGLDASHPDAVLYRQMAHLSGPLMMSAWSLLSESRAPGDLQSATTSPASDAGQAGASQNAIGLARQAFGSHPRGDSIEPTSLCVQAPSVLEVRIPAELIEGADFVTTGALSSGGNGEGSVQMEVSPTAPTAPTALRLNPQSPIVVTAGSAAEERFQSAFAEFRRLFPIALCYTRIVPIDEVVTFTLFFREDGPLQQLMLSDEERQTIDRMWSEFRFVSQEPLLMVSAFEQLYEFATQDRPDLVIAMEPMRPSMNAAGESFRQEMVAAEPRQLDALVRFAATAYRRPLTSAGETKLRSLYSALRDQEIGHEEAFRLTLARIFVAPDFLYRLERAPSGETPAEVSNDELANRLSYFLWSSQPDAPLRAAAAAGTLHQPEVLIQQARRMTADPRIRRLATEFACQWLHIYEFDALDEKSERHFPEFVDLRGDMYEEAIRYFTDLFQRDGSLLEIMESDHALLNERMAAFYEIPDVKGDHWRRVDGVRRYGRGGILGLAATLAKQSGASRTSPILRGTWISEVLLGEKLPRPPKDVPLLPEDEQDTEGLTVRELVARHTSDPKCSSCHKKVDPFGFALEGYDAIGRKRDFDLANRPVDTQTTLPDGQAIEGMTGLRDYMADTRREVVFRQFTRKLLGYALGRTTQLSDEPLLAEIDQKLVESNYRFSTALETIILSEQFRKIRGNEFE